MRELTSILLAMLLVIGVHVIASHATPPGAPTAPPLRQIPGITANDHFPRGCVDCHVKRPDLDMDVRISTQLRKWQEHVEPALLERMRAFTPPDMQLTGIHPQAEVVFDDIPARCLECHGKESTTAPPFGQLLHGLHLAGGENNHFLTEFQGECTHCHKLDPLTGTLSLATAAEP